MVGTPTLGITTVIPVDTRTYGWDSHAGPHDQLVLNLGLGLPRWCSEPIPIPYHCTCSKRTIIRDHYQHNKVAAVDNPQIT